MNEEELIKQVRKHSLLYDTNSPDYKNQAIRNEAWREIGEHMKLSSKLYYEINNYIKYIITFMTCIISFKISIIGNIKTYSISILK